MNWARAIISALFLLMPAPLYAAGADPAQAVVSVVSLDDQGNPWRQGLGVIIGKGGQVLTSAAILGPCQRGILKTADGALHLFHEVPARDLFQDLALVQAEGRDFPAASLGVAAALPNGGLVQVPGRHEVGPGLGQARLVKTLPFSPRLVLLKLEPGDLGSDLGTPIMDAQGELVGMRHSFAGSPGNSNSFQFYLARDRSHLPREILASKNPSGDRPPAAAASADFWAGVEASLRQDWPGARDRFTAALAGPEKLPEAYFGRGVARFHLGDYDRAALDFQEATRRLPRYALAFFFLGQVWEHRERVQKAREAYRQAVAADPELSEAWFRLGVLLYRLGSLGEARECLQKAGDSLPEVAQRWWYLAGIAQALKLWPEALEALKQAVKADPGFFPAYLEEGKLLLCDLGQAEEAVPLLKEAVRLKPRHPLARYYLAQAHLMTWNPGGAWEQYFVLQDLAPDLAANLAAAMDKQ